MTYSTDSHAYHLGRFHGANYLPCDPSTVPASNPLTEEELESYDRGYAAGKDFLASRSFPWNPPQLVIDVLLKHKDDDPSRHKELCDSVANSLWLAFLNTKDDPTPYEFYEDWAFNGLGPDFALLENLQ